ncbi:methyl-accepting chemotaxis protein [Pseudoalteromonas rhizosphaerae]|uniref:methyl-accepting chemotaxis protein n=2 Tax=Pseudoalteromonas TaxID=53246 RepID=UPI00384D03A8
MIRNIKIGMRSALAFGILGLITLILGVFSIMQLSKLNSISDVISLHRIPALTTAVELERYSMHTQLLITELSDTKTQQERNDIQRQLDKEERDYKSAEKRMAALVRSDEAKRQLDNVINLHDEFTATFTKLFRLYEQQNEEEALTFRRKKVMPAAELLISELEKLSQYQILRANQINDEATQTYLNSKAALISGIVITLVLLSVIAFFYSRSLTLPLRYAVAVARRVAKGDLTERINDSHSDEAGEMLQALADMQNQLRETLSQIGGSSQQLATTSEQLTVVTNQSTQIATQQRDQLEQAATAVNELTAAIEEVARSANSTSDNAEVADEKAQLGQAKINETIKTIGSLVSEIQNSAAGITTLAANIKNIESVLDVIRAIADQTNLLALNAAIEAARAGESGRGFAVVADEVRALAHRTQESTKEIEQMIQTVQSETSQAVVNMNNSNQLAEGTLLIANDAGAAFSEITGLISQISNQNITVASAAEEQTTVAREVDKNLVYIRDLSIQSSDGSEQTNASSTELAKLAEQLNNLVLRFTI